MAIKRNAAGGSFISEAGEYRVKVTELKQGLSKSGKAMLTVTFQTADELKIQSYFVKELTFHAKALGELCLAAGKPEAELIGVEVGILVEPQQPDETTGRVFMHVVGYGKASEVTPK